MKLPSLLLSLLLSTIFLSSSADEVFSEYKVKEFTFQEHQAKIVFPNKKSTGDWIWRARFWGHEPQTDKALLEKGFHVVYVDVAGLFGNKVAVELWNAFYLFVRKEYKLNQKVVLEGFSRGGLIVYNWAAENTDKVACIYADAPVCDIKSWPGGLYKGKGSTKDWEKCLKVHGLNEESFMSYEGIPIFTCIKVAQAKIPVMHVCGAADEVVPYEENTAILAETIKANGGIIELILKEGIGHHPHSLKDPKPIVDFILRHTGYE